uniref:Gram-positive cocci surface proteins LPxTG domain-containing protein n=1 Tax=Streptomyces sp. NBC_00049 TaxID=2903617 RepID=A0AAU2JUT7_9ACTN
MRTALRTSIVTAALAGAMLAPAAGAAFAASAPQAATSTKAAESPVKKVDIGDNLIAFVSNSVKEGPRAVIHVVDKDGTTHPKPLVSLDRSHTKESVQGTTFALTHLESATPVLVVSTGGVDKSFPLPKGEPGTDCRSELKQVDMGAGVMAELRVAEYGPVASLTSASDGGRAWATLSRKEPSLPESAGIVARIVNPSSATPVFEWKTQGGPMPTGRASFPAFPKGCKPNYEFTNDEKAQPPVTPKPKPSTTASAPADKKAQNAGQTTVVPKGPVAAGAELPVETVSDADNTTTVAAGAGLMAVFGALGASVVLRRRRAQG